MANKNSNLTFVRCPSCNSLVPALSTRCRMCGATIELNGDDNESASSKESQVRESRVRQKTMTISESMKDSIMEDLGINKSKNQNEKLDTKNPLQDEDDINTNLDFEDAQNNTIDSDDPLASFIEHEDENQGVNEDTVNEPVNEEINEDMDDIFENFAGSSAENETQNVIEDNAKEEQEYINDDTNLQTQDSFEDDSLQDLQDTKQSLEDESLNDDTTEDDLFSDLGDDIFKEDLDLDSILNEANNESQESIGDEDDLLLNNKNDDFLEEDSINDDNLSNESYEDYNIEEETAIEDENDNIYAQASKEHDFEEETISDDELEDEVENEAELEDNKVKEDAFDDEFKSVDEILTGEEEVNNEDIASQDKQEANIEISKEQKQRTTQEISVDPKVKETFEKQKLLNLNTKKNNNIKLNFGPKIKPNEDKEPLNEHNNLKIDAKVKENVIENEEKIEIKVEKVNKENSTIIPEISKLSLTGVDVKKDLKGRLFGWLVSFKNQSGKAFELREGKFFVTKSSLKENDLIINDDSISTPHALMTVSKNNGLILQDLMSETGIYLKHDKDAEYEKQEAPFKVTHGDWVKFGNVEYLVSLIAYVGE